MLKKEWKRYKNLTLQKKMTLIFLFALSVMMIFSLIFFRIIARVYDEKLYERSVLELEYFCNLVENEMKDVEELTFEIAMDREFQKQLYEMIREKDKQLKWLAMDSFKDKMNVESVRDNCITAILYDNKKDIRYEVLNAEKEIPAGLYEKILQKTTEAHGGYVYLLPTEDYPYILSGRDIRERLNLSLEYLGTLVVTFDIRSIISENLDTLSGVENNLCVYVDDIMIYNNNPELFSDVPGVEKDSGYEIVNKNGEKYFRCYLKSAGTGWTFVNECTYDSIYQTTVLTFRVLILATVLLFAVLALLLRKVCRIITMPLNNLADSMRIVENGDFEQARNVLLPIDTQDEVGVLSEEFRIMLEKIVVLIHENYEKQITLMDSRYKALQAQINPHFLYNTLNSVGWMIKAGRSEEAQKMLTALGRQLRAAFKEEPFSTLEEEIELLEHYIYIQKIRYQDRVEFVVQVQNEVLDSRVPRLSLQPLVENALNYGVENCPRKCTVKVSARQEAGQVRIEVCDDGMGMDEERLKEVQSFSMQPRRNGIGLKNINQRLELIYGREYEFRIESKADAGTVITITIPGRKDADVQNGGY